MNTASDVVWPAPALVQMHLGRVPTIPASSPATPWLLPPHHPSPLPPLAGGRPCGVEDRRSIKFNKHERARPGRRRAFNEPQARTGRVQLNLFHVRILPRLVGQLVLDADTAVLHERMTMLTGTDPALTMLRGLGQAGRIGPPAQSIRSTLWFGLSRGFHVPGLKMGLTTRDQPPPGHPAFKTFKRSQSDSNNHARWSP